MTIDLIEISQEFQAESGENWMETLETLPLEAAKNLSVFDLRNLILDCQSSLESQAIQKNILWNLDLGEPVFIRNDRRELGSAITHILSNAIRYNRQSGRVDVHVSADDTYCKLTVLDTGMGIDPEKVSNVFSVQIREEGKGGLAMGLYTCREILESMGGMIALESSPGNGTKVELYIPISIG